MNNKFNFKEHFDNKYMHYMYLALVVLLTLTVRLLSNAQVYLSLYIFVVFFTFLYVIKKADRMFELLIYYFFFFLYTLILAYGFYNSFLVTCFIALLFSSTFYGILILDWHLNRVLENKLLVSLLTSLGGVIMLIIYELCRFYFPIIGEYEFFENKLLLQWASLFGPLGIDFLVLFICEMLANLVIFGYKKIYALVGTAAVIIICLTIYSTVRITNKKDPQYTIKVAMATGPYQGKETIGYIQIPYDDNIACFDSVIAKASTENASLLAFCEEAFAIRESRRDEFISYVCSKASMYNMNIVLACEFEKPNTTDQIESGTNEILFIDSTGNVVNNYLKYKTIPLIEDNIKRGEGFFPDVNVNIEGHDMKISYCICYDSDFSTYITRINKDVDLFIVPTWDWDGIQNRHYKAVGTNSVTHLTTTVKVTYDGYTTVTNQYGDLLYKENTNDVGYGTCVTVDVPINANRSPYDVIGKYLNSIYFAAFVCISVVVVSKRINDNKKEKNKVI